jgi:hypothetical protein
MKNYLVTVRVMNRIPNHNQTLIKSLNLILGSRISMFHSNFNLSKRESIVFLLISYLVSDKTYDTTDK